MPSFIHTSDWQLGLKLRFVPEGARARAQLARFQVIERIAQLAKEREVDAVIVAGDVLDDNAVGRDVLQQARDALACIDPIPVLLLPGNHDPATPDSALARLETGDRIRVATDDAPWTQGAITFHPCPLSRRHEGEDPTSHLADAPRDGRIHVVVAHGGAIDFSEDTETPNRIDWQAVLARGYDYLALGDWHGTLSLGERVRYSGAPEATRFKEKAPGNVLFVDIAAPGADPAVETIPVARTKWLEESRTLTEDADLDVLESWLDGLEDRSWTLLDLRLNGGLSLRARARLDALLERANEELLLLRLSAFSVTDQPTDEDLADLSVEGFVGQAAAALRDSTDDDAAAALRLLYRFVHEEEPA